jgi:gas vesicle protein
MGRKSNAGDTAKKIAIGGAIAAAAGYVAGLLTAPKSGKETRQDLKEAANRSFSEAERELKKLHTELGKGIDQAKKASEKLSGKAQGDLSELIEKAKDTKERAREVLSAIHEGSADDKDLDKAIKDANRALDHIRDYLKK